VATYSGGIGFVGSTSSTLTQTVNSAPPTTTTVLASSVNPSTYGESTTLTATVTSSTGATPTGTVYFYNGAMFIEGVKLNSSGVATLAYAKSSGGTNSLTAKYVGNATFPASTSNTVAQMVTANATSTVLSSATAGMTTTFTAAVTSGGSPVPYGTVQFFFAMPFGEKTIYTGVDVNSSGDAVLTNPHFPAGAMGITAVYLGYADYSGSTSNTIAP
jgi:Bacterial Ig-like domain (group 3)